VEKQCQLISEIISNLFDAQSKVWLSSPYFPLPGDSEYPVLPNADCDSLVKEAYINQLKIFDNGNKQAKINFDDSESPKKLAIPLVSQDNMLGILEISRAEGKPFEQHEINFLEGLASHAAVSMQIIRQVTIKNWRMEQLSLVRTVSEQIAKIHNVEELSTQITCLIQETFKYYYVAIFLVNGKKRTLELKGNTGANADAKLPMDFSIQMGEGIIGFVAKSGREIIAPDVNDVSLYRKINQLPETKSEAALPLKIDKKILGVLDIQSDQGDRFHDNDLILLRALANSIAIAVQDSDLYGSLQRRAKQIATIFEVSNAINSILDFDELMQKIILTIKQQFHCDEVHLFTVHTGRRKIFYQTGMGKDNQETNDQTNFEMDNPEGIIPWVARSGISAMTNNAADDGRFLIPENAEMVNHSQMVIPLQYAGEVLGILQVQNRKPDSFDEHDLFLFEAIASNISTAVRNATLFRSEHWRHQVADSFRDVIGLISANTATDELLSNILLQLNRNLPCDASAIWLLDNNLEGINRFDTHSLREAATWGIEKGRLTQVFSEHPQSFKSIEEVIALSTPIIRSPDAERGPLGIVLNFPKDYSSITVPLKIGDSILGILALAHKTAKRYGSEAKDMTTTFANYAAVAIHNARLYSDSQEQAWISTVLLQVAQTCQASLNAEDLLKSMVRLTPLMVGVQKCAFYLWDDFYDHFALKAQYGFSAGLNEIWTSDTPAIFQILHNQRPVFIQDPKEELRIDNFDLDAKNDTFVILPLIIRGEILGAFLIVHAGNVETNLKFSNQTLAILQGISQQTAISLDNMRLIEARQEEAYITAVLLQVAQAVVSQSNLEDTFNTIVNLLPILIGVNACAIYLPSQADPTQFAAAEAFAGHFDETSSLKSDIFTENLSLLGFVQNTNQITLGYLPDERIDIETWKEIRPFPVLEKDFTKISNHMLLAFPITIKNELLGVLLTKEDNLAPQYFYKRIELLTGVSQEIALAIQNHKLQQDNVLKEKLEQEIQLARQIQKTFLPDSLPEYKGWEIGTKWETALQVGGDFYDVIPISKTKVGLVIADVADKGLAASLYMTVSRTLIRAFGQIYTDPASVLKHVNNLLIGDAPGGLFVTAIFAILNVESGELIYANAGHNLPLLLTPHNNHIQDLAKGEMALGVMEDIEYTNHTIQIKPADILLFYTDGLTEAFSRQGEIFGIERLKSALTRCKKDTVQFLIESFTAELSTFRDGNPPSDDLTMIVIKWAKQTQSTSAKNN
jgi:serine phosphatase RsbU (regulator of sigma subunit)/putative methionine-R-sulfoxide reductase with GAF domain